MAKAPARRTKNTYRAAFSREKSSRIYRAVHDVLMDLRVELQIARRSGNELRGLALDDRLADAMSKAANAAANAYEEPLRKAQG